MKSLAPVVAWVSSPDTIAILPPISVTQVGQVVVQIFGRVLDEVNTSSLRLGLPSR